VQWLDLLILSEAAGGLVLATLNGAFFARLAQATRRPPRRVAALALTLVNGGLALEALLFLALASSTAGVERLAVLGVRSALFVATAFLALLAWRHGWRP